MGVVNKLAEQVLAARYEDLSPEVVHQAKRLLLDSIGCTFGGRECETARIVEDSIDDFGGPVEATVVGSGRRTSALNALLVNGAMLRFLDYNDVQFSTVFPGPWHGHNSEVFPAILALCERQGLGGREAIVATVAGFDLGTRFTEGLVAGKALEPRGWNLDSRAGFVIPLVAGRLLGMNSAQMENAVGVALSRGMVFGILDNPREENTMAKNLRFPLTAHMSVMATFLARRGITGPARALEGNQGFIEVVLGGQYDLERLTAPKPVHSILEAGLKQHASCYSTHGHVTATLDLVLKHDIRPEEVKRVRIQATTRSAAHTGDANRRNPTNKESADHSAFYLTAIEILERKVGPKQFSPEKYVAPEVRRIMDVTTVEPNPELDPIYPSAIVEIETTRGETYRQHTKYAKGHPLNPMTDADIEEKFTAMAEPFLGKAGCRAAIDAIWHFDECKQVSELMPLLVAKQ